MPSEELLRGASLAAVPTALPARHPDLRKTIFQHQSQNQLGILAIRLLLSQESEGVSFRSMTRVGGGEEEFPLGFENASWDYCNQSCRS